MAQTIVEKGTSKTVSLNASGNFIYSKDDKGNCLPDFSNVGYHSGEKAIPDVAVEISLEATEGDNTQRLQEALDQLATLPLKENGFRGALLLKRGTYQVAGRLVISHSGIVLRGEGHGVNGTVLVATGYDDMKLQRALITVGPERDHREVHNLHGYEEPKVQLIEESRQAIIDDYVPIGAHRFSVRSTAGYKVGDRIVVYRPATEEWIRSMGCDRLKPKWAKFRNASWVKDGEAAGFYYQRLDVDSKYRILREPQESWDDFKKRVPISENGDEINFTQQWQTQRYHYYFERKITAIEGNLVTIDAPLFHALDQKYGGGEIYHYESPGRVSEVGIENIRMISEFASPIPNHPYGDPTKTSQAEGHAWIGVQLQFNTENTWVRKVTGNYFGWALVAASGKNATIQDCINLGHASIIRGGRRYPFMIDGQFNLAQRCATIEGRHEFVTRETTAGPNVFVDCIGMQSKSCAGPHARYAIGTLFDNVQSEQFMESRFRGNSGTGHGWAGTQTCFYNCIAPNFKVAAPPGGMCWVIGSGSKDEKDCRASPPSLYYQQVQDRLGKSALDRLATEEQRLNLGSYLWAKERLKDEAQ